MTDRRITRERIFREALAAILGSKLRSSDLRVLAELFEMDGRFARDLAKAIWDVSSHLKEVSQEELVFSEPVTSLTSDDIGGIADLAYKVVQRRRISRAKLLSLFKGLSPSVKWPNVSSEAPVKQLIERFFEKASTAEAQKFLEAIGMEISQDPYLGGITDRPRK